MQAAVTAGFITRCVLSLRCLGAVKGTRIFDTNGVKRMMQTKPTSNVGVNLVPDPQMRVKRDQKNGTGRVAQVRQLHRLGEGM